MGDVQELSAEVTTRLAATWAANLSAIRVVDPSLAGVLERVELPAALRWAHGRDGIVTAQWGPTPNSSRWLGGTSSPSISAPAILRDFKCTGGNVLVPVLGTGYEAAYLCGVLRGHCALFVFGQDACELKAVLHICDLSSWIESGRLVFVLGDDCEAALRGFLRDHPGYEAPTRLVTMPHLDSGMAERLRVGLERCALLCERERDEQIRGLHERWSSESQSRHAVPRVAIISSEARTETFALVDNMQAALGATGVVAHVDVPTSPRTGHLLTKLQLLREFRPDWVLASGYVHPRWIDAIPACVPVISWTWPGQIYKPSVRESGHGRVKRFVADVKMLETSADAGEPPELLEVGAAVRAQASPAMCPFDIVVAADLPSIEPESVGISQPTHVMLWKALCLALAERVAKSGPPDMDDFVSQILRRSGVELKDGEVRSRLVEQLEDVALVRYLALDVAESLKRAGHGVGVLGSQWPEPWAQNLVASSEVHGSCDVLASARLVVYPVWEGQSVACILDLLGAGGRPLLRASRRRIPELHPQLFDVLEPLPRFRSSTELVRALGRRTTMVEYEQCWVNARSRVHQAHTLSNRLEFLAGVAMGDRGASMVS